MWKVSSSVVVRSSYAKIWNIWSKPHLWPTWDQEVESCILHGEFKQGSTGTLVPKGGPGIKFDIIKLEDHKSFTDVAKLPLTKLIFEHEMAEIEPGLVEITHTVKITGMLSFLFSRTVGAKIARALPHSLENLARQVE